VVARDQQALLAIGGRACPHHPAQRRRRWTRPLLPAISYRSWSCPGAGRGTCGRRKRGSAPWRAAWPERSPARPEGPTGRWRCRPDRARGPARRHGPASARRGCRDRGAGSRPRGNGLCGKVRRLAGAGGRLGHMQAQRRAVCASPDGVFGRCRHHPAPHRRLTWATDDYTSMQLYFAARKRCLRVNAHIAALCDTPPCACAQADAWDRI
jgi:hypothetical protein